MLPARLHKNLKVITNTQRKPQVKTAQKLSRSGQVESNAQHFFTDDVDWTMFDKQQPKQQNWWRDFNMEIIMTNKFGGECKKNETNERRYLLNADTQKNRIIIYSLKTNWQ